MMGMMVRVMRFQCLLSVNRDDGLQVEILTA